MIPLLQGIRVLEVGSVVLGPYAGQILADLGAEVIKIEPLQGDIARDSHPSGPTTGGSLYVNNNRNKRTLAIDLKRVEGQEAMARLIARSDVLFHNMRTDAAERLGLTFDAARAINPQIIHCSAIGFGQRGRHRDRPAFDDIIQAASGVAGIYLEAGGDPHFMPTILADKVAALHAVYGILAALVARGQGRRNAIEIEVPMFETISAFILNEHLAGATFEKDGKVGYPRILSVNRRPFRTADGWIAVLPYTGDQWRRFLAEVDRDDICQADWFNDPRIRQERIDDLYGIVAACMPARTTEEWVEALTSRDVPCSEVNALSDLLTDGHLADIGFFDVAPSYPAEIKRMLPQPVHFSGIAAEPDTPPPPLGADSRAVLDEAGLGASEIDRLIATGVVAAPPIPAFSK